MGPCPSRWWAAEGPKHPDSSRVASLGRFEYGQRQIGPPRPGAGDGKWPDLDRPFRAGPLEAGIAVGASKLVHSQSGTRAQPRRLHRPREPGDRFPEPAEDQVRYPEGPGAAGREGKADRQEGVRRLEPVSA